MAVFAEAFGYQLQPGDSSGRTSATRGAPRRRILDSLRGRWHPPYCRLGACAAPMPTSKADETIRERQPDLDIFFCQASNANFGQFGKTPPLRRLRLDRELP